METPKISDGEYRFIAAFTSGMRRSLCGPALALHQNI